MTGTSDRATPGKLHSSKTEVGASSTVDVVVLYFRLKPRSVLRDDIVYGSFHLHRNLNPTFLKLPLSFSGTTTICPPSSYLRSPRAPRASLVGPETLLSLGETGRAGACTPQFPRPPSSLPFLSCPRSLSGQVPPSPRRRETGQRCTPVVSSHQSDPGNATSPTGDSLSSCNRLPTRGTVALKSRLLRLQSSK